MDIAALFREHGPYVYRVLRRLGVGESDVPDACQEVFVVVHRRAEEFEGRSSVRTWLYGIAARVASEQRRRVRRRRELVTDVPPELLAENAPDEATLMRQARDLLDGILDTLDDDKRAVFVLYEIEELSMAEVATALECPLQTAYSRLHAARGLVEAGIRRVRGEDVRGGGEAS